MKERENIISPAYIADRIHDYFSSWGISSNAVTVIIMGKPGPTGKTWLYNNLKLKGFNAIELDLTHCRADVEYYDDGNLYTIDGKTVYVVLNERLPQYRDKDDFDPEVYDVNSMYPKTIFKHPEERIEYMKWMKRQMNSVYGSGMTGGYVHTARSNGKSLYTLAEVEHLIKARSTNTVPKIEHVIFNDPATIVFWNDGTKTVVKAQDGEDYDDEKGLAMAISKKALGNKGNYYNTFDKFLIRPEEELVEPSRFVKEFNKLLTDEQKEQLTEVKSKLVDVLFPFHGTKKDDDKCDN